MRQTVKTVPTQSKESLDINPESEKPNIPELEGEVSGALNHQKDEKKDGMEKSDDRPLAKLDKILTRTREAHEKMEKIPADVAAWGEPKPEASREALSPKIRHANIRKTSKNRADIEVEQRGIMQSASETTEDCERQAVKTVASQKHKKMTPTQSKESLDINPKSEKPHIPEPEGKDSRALNQQEVKIQLPENQLPVEKVEENHYETGAGHTFPRTDTTGVSDVQTSKEFSEVTDQHNCGAEKHGLHGKSVGHALTKAVVSGNNKIPHLQQQYKQAAIKTEKSHTASSTGGHKIQVTDVGSQTMVGSFSLRMTSGTTLAPVGQELEMEILAAAKRGQTRVGHDQYLTSATNEEEVPREESQCQRAEQPLTSQTRQIVQKRQLSHKEVGKIEKHEIHSSSGQGSCVAAPSQDIVADAEHPVKPLEEERTNSKKQKEDLDRTEATGLRRKIDKGSTKSGKPIIKKQPKTKQVACPQPGSLSGASKDSEGKARESQAWSQNPKHQRYRKKMEKASFINTTKMIELTGPAEDQEQHINISHQDNASQTGTVVIHEEVIGNLTSSRIKKLVVLGCTQ